MKKMLLFVLCVFAGLVVFMYLEASAEVINIENASFEDPILNDGEWTSNDPDNDYSNNPIPGWEVRIGVCRQNAQNYKKHRA
jgi:hypothetical protein